MHSEWSNGVIYVPGQIITLTKSDNRWWMRLWHFLLGRQPPLIMQELICTGSERSGEVFIQ